MANKSITRAVSTEKEIDAWLRKQVKKRKGKYIKLQTDFESGLPDRLILLPVGICYFAELKSTGKRARMLQLTQQAKLLTLGFDSIIIDTMEKAQLLINTYDELRK